MGDDIQKAHDLIRDARMRRGLLKFLWEINRDAESNAGQTPRPMPTYSDDDVKKELKRIIFGK